jgi:LAGLIDADG-like domain
MSTNAMQFAWLAGWFSGDGHISIGRTTRQSAVRLEGSSCDRALLQHVQAIAGCGTIYSRPSDRRGRNGRRKQLFRWQLGGKPAVVLLSKLQPLLVGRRHRATIAAAALSISNRKIRKTKTKNGNVRTK